MKNPRQRRRAVQTVTMAAGLLLVPAVGACGSTQDGTFVGVITVADGTEQAGCSVTAVAGSDVTKPVPEYAAVSDGRGRYEYRLPAGTYKVTALCEAGSASSTGQLAPGERTTLDLSLD